VAVLILLAVKAFLGGGRRNVIVPFGIPVVSGDGQGGELGVTDLDALGIVGLVPLGEDAQSGGRGGGAYEVDDDLVLSRA